MVSMSFLREHLLFICRSYRHRIIRLVRHLFLLSTKKYFIKSTTLLEWIICLLFYLFDLLLIADIYNFCTNIIKWDSRKLNEDELLIAEIVFDNKIKWELVRIDNRAFIASKQWQIAYVSMHTINSWGSISSSLLIHELTHVWQYQHYGLVYIYFALKAQNSKAGYDYGGTFGLAKAREDKIKLSCFNFEQQASIIEDYFLLSQNLRTSKAQLELFAFYANQIKKTAT